MRGGLARSAGCAVFAATLLGAQGLRAAGPMHLDVAPKGGVSINDDQWVFGGAARLGGLCPWVCLGDLGVSAQVLAGLGGNRATVRMGARLDSVFWLGEGRLFGVYPAVGGSAYVLIPAGHFAEFCERTHMSGCGGTRFGFEMGGGVRLGPAFVEAIVGTGQLPVLTVTAGVVLPIWEGAS